MRAAFRSLRRLIRALGYDIARFPREALHLHLEEVFRRLDVNCVLDVGAHRGEFGKLVRGFGYAGPIVSFEPVTANFEALAEAAAADPAWNVHRIALGAEDTTREIGVARYTPFSSFRRLSTVPAEWREATTVQGTEEVRISRLDAIFEEVAGAGTRAFLKLDTQGWDIEVLRGATGCLSSVVALQSEIALRPVYEDAPSYLDALPYMTDLGFDISGLFVVTRDDRLRIVELDCVLIRPEAVRSR